MHFVLPVCAFLTIAFTKPTTHNEILNDVIKMTSYPTMPSQPISSLAPSPSITTPTFAFPIGGDSKQQITAFFDAKIKDPKTKKLKVHTGIDIKANLGTPIIATADGTVSLSKEVGAWGNLLKIKHKNGYETWYAHLKDFEAHFGQSVKKGDVIGYVGMTGNSTGPHLHYELRLHKKSLNPLDYLEK